MPKIDIKQKIEKQPNNFKINMKKSYGFFTNKLVMVGGIIGNQRHMSSIRDGFATFMPLIIVGSLAVLMNNVFINNTSLLAGIFGITAESNLAVFERWGEVASYIAPIFNGLWDATLSIFTIYLTFFIGYFLAGTYENEYKVDKLFGGMIALASWVTLGPVQHGYLGIPGMMTGIAFALMAPTVYVRLANSKKLQITMPDGVPPAVAKSFSQLIPIILTLLLFGMVQPLWGAIAKGAGFGVDILPDGSTITNEWHVFIKAIDLAIASPLIELGNSPGAVFLISLLIGLFWFLGLHGTNVLAPIIEPIWGGATIINASLFNTYGDKVYDDVFMDSIGEKLSLWSKGSFDTMVVIGGAGATLAIIAAIFIFSKSVTQRKVAKVALAPGIFQINEPIMFGIPILLNVTYFIPWLLVMPFLSLFTYLAHFLGFVKPATVIVPWTTPPFISSILATQDWRAFVLTVINFGLAFIAYAPFVLIDAKKQLALEANSEDPKVIEKYIKKISDENKENQLNKKEKRKELKDKVVNKIKKDKE